MSRKTCRNYCRKNLFLYKDFTKSNRYKYCYLKFDITMIIQHLKDLMEIIKNKRNLIGRPVKALPNFWKKTASTKKAKLTYETVRKISGKVTLELHRSCSCKAEYIE